MNRGKPNWEHLSDELHVLITVEDTENRARVKMQRAKEEIEKLLVPTVSILILTWLACHLCYYIDGMMLNLMCHQLINSILFKLYLIT